MAAGWLILAALAQADTLLPTPAQQRQARPDGSQIAYYLLQRTEARSAKALLLIIQGSDCNSVTRIPSVYRHLAQAMPEADVLTVEKYGLDARLPYSNEAERADCPASYLKHDSPSQRVEDLLAVIGQLRKSHAYTRIVALGGSEGAVIAHALAARSNWIDATVAFNGGGQWFLDDLLHSVAVSPLSAAQKSESRASLLAFTRQVRDQPPEGLQVSGHGARWWQEVLRLDQLALLQATRTPALIIQSAADESVSVLAVTSMISKLRQAGRPGLAFHFYPGLDHRLMDADGRSRMADAVQDIASWLRQLQAPEREPG
ncbi:alpha/beta hydrolase [Pseudomonas sp. Fl4BN1]|uniref:alpha/beta hydrolase n=1 Tax=Pseudomonas sp. Fl4BN1 TaxID=2697651 RepID=UPI0013786A39|nr:prolyl oligopeptidase family serine peptidase [Pseudomonas sp. Fl4BN1]NBF08111.1 prolyl oligopeptidase family serine peptidase [Pseudomonas sp. Fl4BN1]